MSARPGTPRSGAALAFVILLMLGILALAHATLVASLSELAGARAALRALETRAAADVGVRLTVLSSPAAWMDSLAWGEVGVGVTTTVGRVAVTGSARRLGPESWLLEGVGRRASGARARTLHMAWALDPLRRILDLVAVVSVGPEAEVELGGTLDAADPTAVSPPERAWDCDPWRAQLALQQTLASLAGVAVLADSVPEPTLGLLDLDAMLAAATVSVSGSGTPAPNEASGACLVSDPWNWGDPDQPWRPCGPHLPLRSAGSDLVVSGGVGQGMLVVDGDVTLAAGTRYFGLVIARGGVSLEGGSVFEGMALAGSGLHIAPGSRVRGSTCWAVRALAAQRPLLGRLLPLESVGRIGPL